MSLFGEPFSKKSIRSQLGHCLAYPLRTRRAFSLNFDLHFEQRTWKVSFVLIDWPRKPPWVPTEGKAGMLLRT